MTRGSLIAPVLLVAALPASAAAQTVEGRVVEDAVPTSPVPGTTVILEDTTGRLLRQVIADSTGRFWLWHDAPGAYLLRAERIGYAAPAGQPIVLAPDEVVQVQIRLRPEAVALEPLRVVTRRHVRRFTVDEFYDRMSRRGASGQFLTREWLESTHARLPSEALRLASGTWVRPSGRSVFSNVVLLSSFGRLCRPAFFLDGTPVAGPIDDWITLDDIEGIEVYRGYSVPGTYLSSEAQRGCGAILLWRRQDPETRRPLTWGRLLAFVVLGGLGMLATFAF